MKATFPREMLNTARAEKWPVLVGIVHRKIGKTDRYDEQVSVSGPSTDEACDVTLALIMWIVDGDSKPERLEKLKALVAAL